MPLIVTRFINQLDNLKGRYLFGVCSYGDSPGIALEYLDREIRSKGGRLSGGFGIHMPYNFVIPSSLKDFYNSFVLREVPLDRQRKLFADCDDKLEGIAQYVNLQEEGRIETKAKFVEHLVDILNLREKLQKPIWLKISGYDGKTDLPFRESINLMDHGFRYDDSCIGCGICTRICPVDNIAMINDRPAWRHHCELCFACLQWCPKEAIQFGSQTKEGKRYHHPEVTLSDMLTLSGEK